MNPRRVAGCGLVWLLVGCGMGCSTGREITGATGSLFLSVGVTGDARVVVVDALGRADSLRDIDLGGAPDRIPGCNFYEGGREAGMEEPITFVEFERAALGHYDFWVSPRTDEGYVNISWIGSTKDSLTNCEGSLLLTGWKKNQWYRWSFDCYPASKSDTCGISPKAAVRADWPAKLDRRH